MTVKIPTGMRLSTLMLALTSAWGTNTAAQEEDTATLNAVSVTATSDLSGAASPLGLSLRETPQSVSRINEQRMQEQGIVTTRDAMQWMPGISSNSLEESESTSFQSRGYRLNNVMVDGVSLSGAAGAMSADLSLYEGIEVLRGPAGLFAGNGDNGSPGGVINLTRKRPSAQRQVRASLSRGSWANTKASLDVSGPLNSDKSLRGRATLSHIDRKFFYENGFRNNWTLGGSLDYHINGNTSLRGGMDLEHRAARVNNYGLSRNFDSSMPHYRRGASPIMPMGRNVYDDSGFFTEINHTFANDWSARVNFTYKRRETDTDYISATNSNWNAEGKDVIHLQSSRSHNVKHSRTLDANVNGHFDLLGRTHEFTTGLNIQSKNDYSPRLVKYGYRFNNTSSSGGKTEIIDESGPGYGYGNITDFDSSAAGYPWLPSDLDWGQMDVYHPTVSSGIYANFRFSLADAWTATTGLRLSKYSNRGRTRSWTGELRSGSYRENNIVTPFAALSWDITEDHTMHISHAEIFEPQNRYDTAGNRVKPLLGMNQEIGLKSEWLDGRLETMLSAYQLERKNDTWRHDAGSECRDRMEMLGIENACYVADNERRTVGVDFEISGDLTRDWFLSFSANWLKNKYTKWKNNGGVVNESRQGKAWDTNRPTQMAKLWSTYRLPGEAANWRIGLGVQVQNKTWTDYSSSTYTGSSVVRPAGTVRQGGYAVYNAAVYWNINKTWDAQLNINNILDKQYIVQISGRRFWWGDPRNFNVTLNGKF